MKTSLARTKEQHQKNQAKLGSNVSAKALRERSLHKCGLSNLIPNSSSKEMDLCASELYIGERLHVRTSNATLEELVHKITYKNLKIDGRRTAPIKCRHLQNECIGPVRKSGN